MSEYLSVTLNAPLQPIHRGSLYEDPLNEILKEQSPGCRVVGGGTEMGEQGPVNCDIDVEILNSATDPALVADILEYLGAPKGSRYRLGDGPATFFGRTEGVRVVLRQADVDPEVFAKYEINELIAILNVAVADAEAGRLQSFWADEDAVSLYYFGPSGARITELVTPAAAAHPLGQFCRISDLPH